MEKKQHIDLNNINNHILLFGGNDDNTDKYGISTNEDRIFKNVSNSDDINLSSGLYIYYDPIYNPQKITFFMYDEKAVGEIENKFVYEIPNDTKISDKNDILKVIIDNIDKVFPEKNNNNNQQNDNNQQIIKEKFFQLFIPCLKPNHKIEQTYLNSKTEKDSFINAQLNEVKKKITNLYPDELKKIETTKKQKNDPKQKNTNHSMHTKLEAFLVQCKSFIEAYYREQFINHQQSTTNINNQPANISIDSTMAEKGYCSCF